MDFTPPHAFGLYIESMTNFRLQAEAKQKHILRVDDPMTQL